MRIWTTLAVLAALIGGVVATLPASAYNCTSWRSGNYTYTNCN